MAATSALRADWRRRGRLDACAGSDPGAAVRSGARGLEFPDDAGRRPRGIRLVDASGHGGAVCAPGAADIPVRADRAAGMAFCIRNHADSYVLFLVPGARLRQRGTLPGLSDRPRHRPGAGPDPGRTAAGRKGFAASGRWDRGHSRRSVCRLLDRAHGPTVHAPPSLPERTGHALRDRHRVLHRRLFNLGQARGGARCPVSLHALDVAWSGNHARPLHRAKAWHSRAVVGLAGRPADHRRRRGADLSWPTGWSSRPCNWRR